MYGTHLVTEVSGSAKMVDSPTLLRSGSASSGSCRADISALISVDWRLKSQHFSKCMYMCTMHNRCASSMAVRLNINTDQ